MLPGLSGIAGFAGAVMVSLSDESILDLDAASSNATLTILNNGTIAGVGNVDDFTSQWITPIGAAGNAYEARATLSSGDTPFGTMNTWLGLGTNRSWSLSQSGIGSMGCDILIEIRNATSMLVLDSATYSLSATVPS